MYACTCSCQRLSHADGDRESAKECALRDARPIDRFLTSPHCPRWISEPSKRLSVPVSSSLCRIRKHRASAFPTPCAFANGNPVARSAFLRKHARTIEQVTVKRLAQHFHDVNQLRLEPPCTNCLARCPSSMQIGALNATKCQAARGEGYGIWHASDTEGRSARGVRHSFPLAIGHSRQRARLPQTGRISQFSLGTHGRLSRSAAFYYPR